MILQCYTKNQFIELYSRALLFINESRSLFVCKEEWFLRNVTSGLLTLNEKIACNFSSLFIKKIFKNV